MPTGYTAGIEDGQITTFPEYLWTCARAMGALIMMRDDPFDAPIPEEFKPSSFYKETLERKELELETWQSLSVEKQLILLRQAQFDKIEQNKKYEEKQKVINARYEAMLKEVRKWNPPTKDHEGLKEFMIEQIQLCTRYKHDYDTTPKEITEKDIEEHTASLFKDVQYYRTAFTEEVKRVEGRNAWLKQLRESVPIPKKKGKK